MAANKRRKLNALAESKGKISLVTLIYDVLTYHQILVLLLRENSFKLHMMLTRMPLKPVSKQMRRM